MNLTEEQIDRLKDWVENARKQKEAPDLLELTRFVFDNKMLDGRAKEGKLVKKYLVENKIDFSTRKPKSRSIELTPEQEAFILNNMNHGLSYLEISRVLFDNPMINNLYAEARAVLNFINERNPVVGQEKPFREDAAIKASEELDESGDELQIISPLSSSDEFVKDQYKPPKTLDQTIARIRRYVSSIEWKRESIKERDLKCVTSLMKYMNTLRFLYQMGTYVRVLDRELFEDTFVRYTYDKEDLSEEELDQYITLCTEIVISANVFRRMESLTALLDNQVSSDENGQKIKMTLNEAINTIQTEYNSCLKRQKELYDTLIGKRSTRLNEFRNENASIANLVKVWKQEEERKKMLIYAQMEDESLRKEAKRLFDADAITALIKGISVEDIVNG